MHIHINIYIYIYIYTHTYIYIYIDLLLRRLIIPYLNGSDNRNGRDRKVEPEHSLQGSPSNKKRNKNKDLEVTLGEILRPGGRTLSQY